MIVGLCDIIDCRTTWDASQIHLFDQAIAGLKDGDHLDLEMGTMDAVDGAAHFLQHLLEHFPDLHLIAYTENHIRVYTHETYERNQQT